MSAGNGGLMRIAAGLIPLKYSDNDWDVIHLASELNDLTHPHLAQFKLQVLSLSS